MKRLYRLLICIIALFIFSAANAAGLILIEWEKQEKAQSYYLQISDTPSFQDILYKSKQKGTKAELPYVEKYKYGRVAAIDENGIVGIFSEPFQVEELIIKKVAPSQKPPIEPEKDPTIYVPRENRIEVFSVDNLKVIKGKFYRIDSGKWRPYQAPVNLSKPGVHTIYYYSIDGIGNAENPRTKTYIVDGEAPNIHIAVKQGILQGSDLLLGQNTTITVHAKDTQSGVKDLTAKLIQRGKSIPLQIANGGSVSLKDTSFAYGILELSSTDQVGNQQKKHIRFTKDVVAPQIRISPDMKETAYFPVGSKFQLFARDTSSGVARISYSINGKPLQAYSEEIIFSNPGEYTISVEAIDRLGNKSRLTSSKITVLSGDFNSKIKIQKK
ncbi:MAG: hypothetical protein AAF518_18490 [Spirochaetota bacterium]